MKERLQKLLAQANIGSRRASEELISKGRVRVNGVVAQLGDKADLASDAIEVDGARLKFDSQGEHVYIMLNKPKQVLSTDKPHRGDKRETVARLLGRDEHLFSIGRLDADSEGLVVMTNDGDLAQKLSHPKYRHTKTYRVEVLGLPTAETLEKWQRGVTLEDGQTAPCFVEIVRGSPRGTVLRVVMTEGKKRQIRRVASLLGHPVRRLTRTHIGMLALGDLEAGQSRELTPKEIMALRTPSPEIKTLRATPRRRAADHVTDAAEEPRARSAESPDETGAKRPVRRTRPSVSAGEAATQRRTPRTNSGDEEPRQRRSSRVTPGEAPPRHRASAARTAEKRSDDGTTRRIFRARPSESSDEAPGAAHEKRPVRRIRTSDSPDEAQDKRRAPRAGRAKASGEAPDRRPARRTRPSDSPDDAPSKPRKTRVKPSEAPEDQREQRRAPRARKPASAGEGGKKRAPKPYAPFKKRGPVGKRKPRGGKGSPR